MIPKVIHLCWLSGDKYPEKIRYCIHSWNRVIPEYEIILWDMDRCRKENILTDWVEEACSLKKYAFASDYIRLYAVYKYGGIYLDSDVEVVKSFDPLLHLPYFIGHEAIGNRIEIAAFGAVKGCRWVRECLNYYTNRHFLVGNKLDMKVAPDIIYETLKDKYVFKDITAIEQFDSEEKQIYVFPREFFCANICIGTDIIQTVTQNTFCIHHFANSWIGYKHKFLIFIRKYLGERSANVLLYIRELIIGSRYKYLK